MKKISHGSQIPQSCWHGAERSATYEPKHGHNEGFCRAEMEIQAIPDSLQSLFCSVVRNKVYIICLPALDRLWIKISLCRLKYRLLCKNVTDVYSGGLPSGTGSQLLAEGLKSTGLKSGGQFSITGIINQETKTAYQNGIAASDSLLGKTAANALNKMGLEPSSIQYQVIGGKLAITVGVK
jgi:hypothetical protein